LATQTYLHFSHCCTRMVVPFLADIRIVLNYFLKCSSKLCVEQPARWVLAGSKSIENNHSSIPADYIPICFTGDADKFYFEEKILRGMCLFVPKTSFLECSDNVLDAFEFMVKLSLAEKIGMGDERFDSYFQTWRAGMRSEVSELFYYFLPVDPSRALQRQKYYRTSSERMMEREDWSITEIRWISSNSPMVNDAYHYGVYNVGDRVKVCHQETIYSGRIQAIYGDQVAVLFEGQSEASLFPLEQVQKRHLGCGCCGLNTHETDVRNEILAF